MKHLDDGTLQAWLDRPRSGLDPSEVAEIERHLASCEACAARLEDLGESSDRVRVLLSSGRDGVADAPAYEAVTERAEGSRRRRVARKRLTTLAWAASIVVAIGVGWLTNDLYRTGTELQLESPRQEVAPARAQTTTEADAREPSPSDAATAASRQSATQSRPAPAAGADLGGSSAAAPSPAARPAAPGAAPSAAGAAASSTARSDVATPGAAGPAALAEKQAAAAEPTADAVAAPAEATKPVVVSGRVLDDRGDPLSSAQVFVSGGDVGALTGPDGSYSLRLPPRARSDSAGVDLTVERIGFGPQTRTLAGLAGDTVVADFRLEERALQLDEVVVTGTAPSTPRRSLGNSVQSLSPSPWIAATRSAADDALGTPLRTIPGLEVLSIEVGAGGGQDGLPIVRVRQELGDGITLTLMEGRSDASREQWPVTADGSVDSIRVGDLLITGTAAVSPESLRAMLESLR